MKDLILFVLKPLSFLPALAIMYIIYSFSGQTGDESGNLSYKVSVKAVETANEVLDRGLEEWEIEETAARIEYPVRKIAHMTEYFVLAVAVSFPFYVYGLRGFGLMLVAGFICVGFAAGDEYHQSFVDGRGPSITDVGIDSIGAFCGILLVRIVCFTLLAPARMLERAKRRARRRTVRHSSYETRTARRAYTYDKEERIPEDFSRRPSPPKTPRTRQNTKVVRPPREVKPDTAAFHTFPLHSEFLNDSFEKQLGREIKQFTEDSQK